MHAPTLSLVERLDRLLPQTQCGQCGYDGCRPYAEAMARGDAGIDHCPPGGDAGARALARLLEADGLQVLSVPGPDEMDALGSMPGEVLLDAGQPLSSTFMDYLVPTAAEVPVVEVHLSNIFRREPFRHPSYVSPAAFGVLCGFGPKGYVLALDGLHAHLSAAAKS